VLLEQPSDSSAQLTLAFRLVLSRAPKPAELAALEALFRRSEQTYAMDPGAAEQAVGTPAPANVLPSAAAAMVNVARMLLNLDEAITRE